MLIRTKLLLLALVPAPVLLLLGGYAVYSARDQLQAAEQTVAALQLVQQADRLARALNADRDAASAAASSEARGLEALLLGEPASPASAPPAPSGLAEAAKTLAALPLKRLAAPVREGAQAVTQRLRELQATPAGQHLEGTLQRYLPSLQALSALPDLASAGAGSGSAARDLRSLAAAARLRDALALERIYVRHALVTHTLPPDLARDFAAAQGDVAGQLALIGNVFGDAPMRSALAAAVAQATAAGRERVLMETRSFAQRQDSLSQLYDALGYGGLRFQFMNYLLRGEEAHRSAFVAQAAAARGIVEQLGTSGALSPAETSDLETVGRMIRAYAEALPRLTELRRQGSSPAAIDQQLRIDDAPALAALDRLAAFRSALGAERWDALSARLLGDIDRLHSDLSKRTRASVDEELVLRQRQMVLTITATVLTLLLLAAIATPLYLRLAEGIRLLAAEFERVVRTGDVLPRQVVSGDDELGQINRAVVHIGQRLDELARAAERMATGDPAETPAPLSADDRLAHAMTALAASARAVVTQTQAISAGDYETLIAARGERDELVFALSDMAAALRKFRDEMRQTQWLSDSQLRLLAAMGNANNLQVLAQQALQALSTLTSAPMGVIYIPQAKGLSAVATLATAAELDIAARLAPGEGLVGRALLMPRTEVYRELPPGYLRLKSGLGGADVTGVTLTPLRARGEPAGVLELGWLSLPQPRDLALLDAASESLGLALTAAEARARTETLLQETRDQANRLRDQQEELRQSNEELEQQAQLLRQSEEELKSQREELQTTNEELEEKSRLLQRQREQLERTAQDLMQATRYKSEFLANMSHELRTPLNSLLILSKSLMSNEERNLTPEQVQYAQVINEGGRELLHLIDDILDLSKVEAGHLDLHPDEFRIDSLFEGLQRQFQPQATDKHLELRFDVAAEVPEQIVSDRQRLEQILRNLLANALKFTEQGGVRLKVERAAPSAGDGDSAVPMLAFHVEDSGIGIPPEKLELIFQAFHQADGSTSRRYGGTGLGLTIARQLAGLLGGSIQVSSRVGEGSRFSLLLPEHYAGPTLAIPRPAAPPPAVAATPPEPPSPAETIPDDRASIAKGERSMLVIEDDLHFAGIVREVVRKRGYKCLVATTGGAGLQLAREFLPSAIILDLRLPDMDGRRVLDVLKWATATRHIPVHVISALGAAATETLKQGAIGFLHKPAELADLQQVVDRIDATLSRDTHTVLVVEDDVGSRAAVAALLKNEHTQILTVSTAAEALQRLQDTTVDCIVLDLSLPDGDGIDLLEQLRRDREHLHPPVVVYTARQLSTEEHRRLSELAQSVVIKGAKSADRLLDEVLLFLHAVEQDLPEAQKEVVARLHNGVDVLQGRKVLLVDDDLRNVFALSGLLRKRGLEVLVADNGQMALERLNDNPDVAAVLMDVMMPIMDGYEATRRIRTQERFRKLPVIAVTAKAMSEDRRRCMEAGASDYLSKPVELESLLAMLRIWIGRNP